MVDFYTGLLPWLFMNEPLNEGREVPKAVLKALVKESLFLVGRELLSGVLPLI